MKELIDRRLSLCVVPAQVYLVPPTGFHLPPLSWRNRQQSPVLLVPTCCGRVMPLAVQLSALRSASISVARLSLPPRATDCSTNSRAADHEKTPKKVGDGARARLLEPAQVELHLLVGAGLLERHEVR